MNPRSIDRFIRRPLLCAHLIAVPALALADDYYVDATSGSDMSGGTSELDAWQTLSHSIESVPAGAHVLHVAPGVYDPALGESFPLRGRNGLTIVGDGGSAVTHVVGGGGGVLFRHDTSGSGGPVLRGLTLSNADYGIRALMPIDWDYSVALHDVEITGMTSEACLVTIDGFGAYASITLEHVRIHGNGAGLAMLDWGAHGGSYVEAFDSEFFANDSIGIEIRRGTSSDANLELVRCRISGNGTEGVRAAGSNSCCGEFRIEECLIVDNGTDGFVGQQFLSVVGADQAFLERSTIVGNGQAGVRNIDGGGQFDVFLEDCILVRNGDDLAGPIAAAYCDIGDGDQVGVNGNISVNPLFVDLGTGDYHLQAASPCIDAGNPSSPLDPDCTVADMGVFYFPQNPPLLPYCTAKVNSQGCTPAIGFTGLPSASAGSGFDVTAVQVLNNKNGIFFYGLAADSAPFQGGVRCVASPIVRTPVQDSRGNPPPDDCTGTYVFDFNAYAASGVDPSLVAGVTVYCQYWYRDPQDAFGSGLTDALQFTLCP